MFFAGLVIVFSLAIPSIESILEVTTDPDVTAYKGGNITLPCGFVGDPDAVWWFKHNKTGATHDQSSGAVVQYFNGRRFPSADGRSTINANYSMVISNVTIADETTYSCKVALVDGNIGANFTNLTVIALANPKHPVVSDCVVSEPGECDYEVAKVVPESFELTCRVNQVRPAVLLSWTTTAGVEKTPSNPAPDPDQFGLFNVVSILQVSKSEIGESFVCKAEGGSVNGISTMEVSVNYPAKTGLSAGAKAGIAIPIIFIGILAAVIGAAYFIWRKRRRNESDEREAMVPLQSPEERDFNELAEKIKEYHPGSFCNLEVPENLKWPEKTRLGVFGVTHAGKSSFVRSLAYSLKGDYIQVEVAQSHSIGGVTIVPKKFAITDYISVVDNRGLKDLDSSCISDILAQIRGQSKILEGTVDFPILVFDARQPVNALDKFLPDFVKAIRDEFGSHPAIVFTHRSAVSDRKDTIKAQAVGMGALDQKLYFIENFTEEPNQPCFERRKEFLDILKKMLECADENLTKRAEKKMGGNGASSSNPQSTDKVSGSKKGFFGFKK